MCVCVCTGLAKYWNNMEAFALSMDEEEEVDAVEEPDKLIPSSHDEIQSYFDEYACVCVCVCVCVCLVLCVCVCVCVVYIVLCVCV